MEGLRGEGSQSESGRSDDDCTPTAPPAYDAEALLNQSRTMTESKRDEWLDRIMEEPGF